MGEGPEPGLVRESRWIFGGLLSVVVMILIVAMVASPGTSDSASASDDDSAAPAADKATDEAPGASHDGHEMTAADGEDDKGLADLLSLSHYHPASDEQLDSETRQLLTAQLVETSDLIEQYPTIADAEADGWRRTGPFVPGFGTHYGKDDGQFTIRASTDGDEGEGVQLQLIFDGLDDDSPLAGFMFLALGDEQPEGFAGPYDSWHEHTNICIVETPDAIETPFLADFQDVTEEMCDDKGGQFLDLTAQMVHVWTVPGYESELGTFSELNPAITCPDGTYHLASLEQESFEDPSMCRK